MMWLAVGQNLIVVPGWWPFLANTKLIECGPHVAFNADLILCADAHKSCSDLRYKRFSVVVICLVGYGF